MCIHCSGMHPNTRCSLLGVEKYTPAGFTVRLPTKPVVIELSDDDLMSDVDLGHAKQDSTGIVNHIPAAVRAAPAQLEDAAMFGSDLGLAKQDSVAMANQFLDGLTVYLPSTSATPAHSGHDTVSGNDLVHVKQERVAEVGGHQPASTFNALPIRRPPAPSNGINPERAAMIAATPVSEPPKQQVGQVVGQGPKRSGMNLMPLGRTRPIGTSQLSGTSQFNNASQFCGATQFAGTSQFSGVPQFGGASQLIGTSQFAGVPPFTGASQFNGASQPMGGLQSKPSKRKARRNGLPWNSATVAAGAPASQNGGPGLAPTAPPPGVLRNGKKRGPERGPEQVKWDGLKRQIRKTIKEIHQGRAARKKWKKKWKKNVKTAFDALRPIILGTNMPPDEDSDEDSDEDALDGVPTAVQLADFYDDAEPVIKTE